MFNASDHATNLNQKRKLLMNNNDMQTPLDHYLDIRYRSGKDNGTEINVPITLNVPICLSDAAFDRIKASLEEQRINEGYGDSETLERYAVYHIADLVKEEVNSLLHMSEHFWSEDAWTDDNFRNFNEDYVRRFYDPCYDRDDSFFKYLDDKWVDWASPI
jgi:hypothetical protein